MKDNTRERAFQRLKLEGKEQDEKLMDPKSI